MAEDGFRGRQEYVELEDRMGEFYLMAWQREMIIVEMRFPRR